MTIDQLTEYYIFLDELRESGITNMYGAGSYLAKEFPELKGHGFHDKLAGKVLVSWMKTFPGKNAKTILDKMHNENAKSPKTRAIDGIKIINKESDE